MSQIDIPWIVSLDDHVVEPPGVWVDRLPAKYAEVGPHVVEVDGGRQMWKFEDRLHPTIGLNAVAGKDPKDFGVEPVRFDEMLPGCFVQNEAYMFLPMRSFCSSLLSRTKSAL